MAHTTNIDMRLSAARYKKACEVSQERIRQKGAYNAFIEENPTFVGISEGAMRPLIKEKDPDIRANALQKIGSGVSKGQPLLTRNLHLRRETK